MTREDDARHWRGQLDVKEQERERNLRRGMSKDILNRDAMYNRAQRIMVSEDERYFFTSLGQAPCRCKCQASQPLPRRTTSRARVRNPQARARILGVSAGKCRIDIKGGEIDPTSAHHDLNTIFGSERSCRYERSSRTAEAVKKAEQRAALSAWPVIVMCAT